jgi:hypothetical protein
MLCVNMSYLQVMKLDEIPVDIWGSFTQSDPPKSGLREPLQNIFHRFPCLTRILVCEPMAYRDCSIFEAPFLSSPRLSLEGNAFQHNFEHAWNQFGVRGQVDIFFVFCEENFL